VPSEAARHRRRERSHVACRRRPLSRRPRAPPPAPLEIGRSRVPPDGFRAVRSANGICKSRCERFATRLAFCHPVSEPFATRVAFCHSHSEPFRMRMAIPEGVAEPFGWLCEKRQEVSERFGEGVNFRHSDSEPFGRRWTFRHSDSEPFGKRLAFCHSDFEPFAKRGPFCHSDSERFQRSQEPAGRRRSQRRSSIIEPRPAGRHARRPRPLRTRKIIAQGSYPGLFSPNGETTAHIRWSPRDAWGRPSPVAGEGTGVRDQSPCFSSR
jgi:hypothetical protein